MPVNSNIAIQNVGTLAWDGAQSFSFDIRKFTRFAWSFEVVGPITVNAVFGFEAAPPSTQDPCVPGQFSPVAEIALCSQPAFTNAPSEPARVTIPAGTAVRTICGGTIPCRPNAFVRIVPISGSTSSIRAVMLRQGPKMP
jgi:hypothetical protein